MSAVAFFFSPGGKEGERREGPSMPSSLERKGRGKGEKRREINAPPHSLPYSPCGGGKRKRCFGGGGGGSGGEGGERRCFSAFLHRKKEGGGDATSQQGKKKKEKEKGEMNWQSLLEKNKRRGNRVLENRESKGGWGGLLHLAIKEGRRGGGGKGVSLLLHYHHEKGKEKNKRSGL